MTLPAGLLTQLLRVSVQLVDTVDRIVDADRLKATVDLGDEDERIVDHLVASGRELHKQMDGLPEVLRMLVARTHAALRPAAREVRPHQTFGGCL
jgi:hypothetical protein